MIVTAYEIISRLNYSKEYLSPLKKANPKDVPNLLERIKSIDETLDLALVHIKETEHFKDIVTKFFESQDQIKELILEGK